MDSRWDRNHDELVRELHAAMQRCRHGCFTTIQDLMVQTVMRQTGFELLSKPPAVTQAICVGCNSALILLEEMGYAPRSGGRSVPPSKCPDALLPDGETCPRCGGPRAPSGVDGGSWVHFPREPASIKESDGQGGGRP